MTHNCIICNKLYSSFLSLSYHNRKFHKNNIINKDISHCNILDNVIEENKSVIGIEKINKNFPCRKCLIKNFNCRQNRFTHEKKCKLTNTISQTTDEKIEKLEKEIELLKISNKTEINNKTEVINNKTKINKKINNKIEINNTNNGNIIINNFNNDNSDYISEEFMKKMFRHLLYEDEQLIPIPKIIENIKFNPHHKENNNVKITNIRSDFGMKFDNNKWLTVEKNELLNELFKIGADIFLKFYKEKQGILSEDMKSCYIEFKQASKYDLKDDIKNKIHKVAYMFTKNMELDK